MNADLVPLSAEVAGLGDRRAALERLTGEAERAATPSEARAVMEKSRVIAEALARMRAPAEETRLAGKACVLAARRLGGLLAAVPGEAREFDPKKGALPSFRTEVASEIGLKRHTKNRLVNLAGIPEPDFQRYIQESDIPTITGAFRYFQLVHRSPVYPNTTARKKRAGVKTPATPSLDEAYALIVRALGHLDGVRLLGGKRRNRDVASAMNALYEAEDLLKQHRGGYVR